jgi:hypothetical protein
MSSRRAEWTRRDTNELFTLSWKEKDIEFDKRQIKLRANNAKGNKASAIPRMPKMMRSRKK